MSGGERPLLAIDTGSPRVSVAVGGGGAVLAEASAAGGRSSPTLLALIEGVLREAGARPADLGGLLALRGPGSFTGLRVGLATVLALHQALGVAATAVPTLEVLATLGPGDGSTLVAAVDALRGEWFAQRYRSAAPPRALGEPQLVPAADLVAAGAPLVVGFGVAALADGGGATRLLEPPPLAAVALRHAARLAGAWDPATLVAPLYLRPPAATPARPVRGSA